MQLPAPELVNYYRLAENRIFYIDFEIDESVLEIQKSILNINLDDKNIEAKDRKPIIIVIDTPGGLLSETFCLAHTIMMSKTPVITVNACECYSGGALLLLSGHKRYAFPNSWAMIHSGSSGSGGTFEQNEEYQKMYKRKVESMRKYILDRTGMDTKVFNRNKSKDWYLSDDEQVTYGMVDKIITSLDEII